MPRNLLEAVLSGPFELTPRPDPLPGDLRLGWGTALVVLMLGKSRGKRASLQKLHFLAHSIRSAQTRSQVLQVFAQTRRPSDILVRVEPWLNRAIAFAKGAGFVTLEGGKSVRLTDEGIRVLATIQEDPGLFVEEKRFLQAVSSQVTEGAVEKIMRMELAL